VRISELFRISKWSAGVVGVIISGHLVSGVQAQSVAQINMSGQQQPGQISQIDSFIRDAETAISQGNSEKADQFLRVAEAMALRPDSGSADAVQKIDQLRRQLGSTSSDAMTANAGRGLLMQARRAIAMGDLVAANTCLQQARASGNDYSATNDSVDQVEKLVARQEDLLKLYNAGDADAFNGHAAKFLLEQADDLINRGDAETAKSLISQAGNFPVDLASTGYNVDQLLARANQVKPAPPAPAAESPLAMARKTTSMAMLAIDKKDWKQARFLVDAALALNVPDSQYGADEPRPWQLDLVVRNHESKGTVNSDPQVMVASATVDNGAAGVQQVPYIPSLDTTRNMQVSGQGSQTPEELPLTGAVDHEQLLFKELQSAVFKERSINERMMETEPRAALDRAVSLRSRISSSELSTENRNPLLTIIDRDIREMQRYIDGNLPDIVVKETNADRLETVELSRERKYEVEKQIQKLVEDFNRLMDQQRYDEAEVVAHQAASLDPESEIASLLLEKAKFASRYAQMMKIKGDKEEGFWRENGKNVEEMSIPFDTSNPLVYGDADEWLKKSEMRAEALGMRSFNSSAERQIWNQLKNSKIQGEFRGTLTETIRQISAQAGVSIIFDTIALESENIDTDRMVDVPISNPITLQSALNIVLGSSNLVFIVEDEVIKVTSRTAQSKDLRTQTYYVGDLVFPVGIKHSPTQMNFITPSMQMNSSNTILGSNQGQMPNMGGMTQPVNPLMLAQQMPGFDNPLAGAAMGAINDYRNSGGPQTGTPIYTTTGGAQLGGITQGDFIPLMNLIQQTISSDSWTSTGTGDGTITPFVPNLSLVVSNTQEIQDQIQDLLTRLRELNDVQIVVEVRFITLRDSFFERVGVDFDFSLNDNSNIPPNTQPGDRTNPSTVVGNIGTGGNFVAPGDLDLQFRQNSFASAIPQFPAFTADSAANFGFAILSDIEVFFLLQAAKGDTRSNVSQAPVVTMFNGQSANIFDGSTRPFVTSVIPVVGDFAVAQQPIISLLPEGTSLSVQAVASNDRRHVTLSLNPFFSQITDVVEFTFDGTRSVVRTPNNLLTDLSNLLDNNPNNDVPLQIEQQGVTIQQPVLATTTISTVVQVPDGGTVLMGGIKRMSEGRSERGVPFLSNIPYVNRLFKNVGIGRETSNLMMMVTPRIIIQEEEEQTQVGNIGGSR